MQTTKLLRYLHTKQNPRRSGGNAKVLFDPLCDNSSTKSRR